MSAASATEVPDLVGDGFVSIDEAKDYLRVSRNTVYGLMDRGVLRYGFVGKLRRISKRSLLDYANKVIVVK